MVRIDRFRLADGTEIAIESDVPVGGGGPSAVGAGDDGAPGEFSRALSRIKPTANELIASLRELARQPDEVEVEFGIKFAGQMGALIAKTSTEANFIVRLKWAAGGE
jgi:hypothetical protein